MNQTLKEVSLKTDLLPKSPFWKCRSCRVQNYPESKDCRNCHKPRKQSKVKA